MQFGPQSQVLLALWSTTDWHEPPVTFFLRTSSGDKRNTTHNSFNSKLVLPSRVLAPSLGTAFILRVCFGASFSSPVGALPPPSAYGYPSVTHSLALSLLPERSRLQAHQFLILPLVHPEEIRGVA